MFKTYFEGKTVLVTGVGRGIGRGIAEHLHSYGAKVTGVAKTEENLRTLREKCVGLQTICVDLGDWDSTRTALQSLPPFDYLVNNAAILIPGSFMEIKSQDFEKQMSVNVLALINVAQIVAEGMVKAGIKGSILNMSSDCSTQAFPPSAVYCLTKSAVDMLTKIMSVELGPKKIRVNAVNPAGVYTDMLHTFYESLAQKEGLCVDEYRAQLNSKVPLGSYEMKMEEIVNAVLFMLFPAAPLINGEMLFIDGGLRHA